MKLANKIAVAIAAGVLMFGTAFAGSMAPRFENTVVAKAPDGSVTKFYYDKAGTVSATVEAGGKVVLQSKGTWRQDGANVCLTLVPGFGPFETGKERCIPLQGDKIGDTWTTPTKDSMGMDATVTVTIVKGR